MNSGRQTQRPDGQRPQANAPLYEDPVCHGPADPRVFFNGLDGNWWLLYTSRRATHDGPGVEWGFGTAIGAASSSDGGISWSYRGTLDLRVERDSETYWGPEIVCCNGVFHLFPAYYGGISARWDVSSQPLAHFVSTDLQRWTNICWGVHGTGNEEWMVVPAGRIPETFYRVTAGW